MKSTFHLLFIVRYLKSDSLMEGGSSRRRFRVMTMMIMMMMTTTTTTTMLMPLPVVTPAVHALNHCCPLPSYIVRVMVGGDRDDDVDDAKDDNKRTDRMINAMFLKQIMNWVLC